MADFLGDHRGEAGKIHIESLKNGYGFSRNALIKERRLCRERILFLLGLRNEIVSARQYLPNGTHHTGYVFDAVDDLVISIAENDIAVFPHDFNDKGFLAQIPHLI